MTKQLICTVKCNKDVPQIVYMPTSWAVRGGGGRAQALRAPGRTATATELESVICNVHISIVVVSTHYYFQVEKRVSI